MDDLIIINDNRPTRADAVRNRDHILQVARDLLDAQGVETVTMSAIALEAGVGKGTLYRNFPDKLSLCQALLDHDQRDLQDRTLARLRKGGAPLDDLLWFIEQTMTFIWRNLDMLGGEASELQLGHPAHYWWRQTLRGLIHQIDSTVDVDFYANVLYIMIDPRPIAFQLASQSYTLDQLSGRIRDLARRLLVS
ncbi:MAG: TetR/AcrR family transcriptional regulator [Chloroflexota bacterium]|nr:TetR/AcrR family transcriptional regulator [Chloroflexota bacterium]